VQLWHVVEGHAVDGADQGRDEEDGRPGRDLLEVVTLRALTCADRCVGCADLGLCSFLELSR
jgi:hypothetical protein